MQNKIDLTPKNVYNQRHGYWFVNYRGINMFDGEDDYGWFGNFVNDEIFGYSEEFDENNIVTNKEYYAR